MAMLASDDRHSSRSTLRYRPLAEASSAGSPGPGIPRRRSSRPADTLVTTAPVSPDEQDLELEEPRPLLVRRRPQTTDQQFPARPGRPLNVRGRKLHPLFYLGAGLIAVILLWLGLTQLLTWGTNEYNTIVYGYPRTFQMDAVVGQGDSPQHPSHFIAVNLHGTVSIIEYPAGDPTRARQLAVSSLLGPDQDLAVVTLRFVDLTHNGKPDMLITIGGVQSILVNDGNTFRVPTASEQLQILQQLRGQ
jgi:hypothetical protein